MFDPKKDAVYFISSLGIEGTLEQLIDWSYRYDGDYTDEALEKIGEIASTADWIPEEKRNIPLLVLQQRRREKKEDGTLPYEQMKLDQILYGKVSFSETKDYGEVTVSSEREKVLLVIEGQDEDGFFTASNAFFIDEFMKGEEGWLEFQVGMLLCSSNKSYSEN